ncbi:MAG: hypothetical protein ACFE0J_12775 [Elainellaceae cyanobacterium]
MAELMAEVRSLMLVKSVKSLVMEAGRSLRNLAADPVTIRVCISRHRNGIYADYFG